MVLYLLPSNPRADDRQYRRLNRGISAPNYSPGADVSRGGFLRYVFSDTYVFLAVRIICTRQVANCGPGFKRRIYSSVTRTDPVRRQGHATGQSRARRSYFSITSFSSFRRMTYGWSLRSNSGSHIYSVTSSPAFRARVRVIRGDDSGVRGELSRE